MNKTETFDVWCKSELPPRGWDKYTVKPFETKDAARRWIKRYIPNAETMVLPSRP